MELHVRLNAYHCRNKELIATCETIEGVKLPVMALANVTFPERWARFHLIISHITQRIHHLQSISKLL